MTTLHEPPTDEPPAWLDEQPPPPVDLDTRRNGRHRPDNNTTATPPHDRDAERAIIGSCLLDKQAIASSSEIVTPADFYHPAHELIYDTITHLYARLHPVDPITVADELTRRGQLDRAGGHAALHEAALAVTSTASSSYYAAIVARHALRRRLITAGTRITQLGHQAGDTDPADTITRAHDELTTVTARGIPGVEQTVTSSWAPVDLAQIRANGLTRPTATLLVTTHGQGLIYPGRTHSISGESTTGKTWVTLAGLCQEIETGHPVTFIDFEDRADTLLTRLGDMGADPDLVDQRVRYIGPDRALDAASWQHVETATKDCRIVIIDGVTEAMTMHGWSLLDNEDIASWYELLPRRVAALGPGVMEIDHVVKDKEARGRYAIGGAHKLNGITGCAYSIIAGKPFAVGQSGHSRVIVAKDRHGNVGPVGHTVAEFHVTPDQSRHREAITWELTASQITISPSSGQARLTGYMEKVSRYLETTPGTTQTGVIEVIKGKKDYLVSAITTLLEEGYLRTEPGPRGATFHYTVRPYREEDDPHV